MPEQEQAVFDVDGPFGFGVAFAAGVVSFLSPCMLPLVPAYVTHLAGASAGGRGGREAAFGHALAFVAGFSLVFIALGASVGAVGYALRDQLPTLERIAGVALIALGLNLMGILRFPWLSRTYQLELAGDGTTAAAPAGGATIPQGLGYARSFVVGSAFSIGWTPCIGPILGGILTLAAASSTVAQGTYLLIFYSAGMGLPFLLAGLALGPLTAYLRRIRRILAAIEVIAGLLVIFIGALVFLDRLTIFNRYFDLFGLGSGV